MRSGLFVFGNNPRAARIGPLAVFGKAVPGSARRLR